MSKVGTIMMMMTTTCQAECLQRTMFCAKRKAVWEVTQVKGSLLQLAKLLMVNELPSSEQAEKTRTYSTETSTALNNA